MNRKGITNLPLHGGHPPRWLFSRMIKLSKVITEIIIDKYGQNEFLNRISDPFWFQGFSCVLGFDWHSSGTTTTTCSALKNSIKPEKHGLLIAGGKGKASRQTLTEIEKTTPIFNINTKKTEQLINSSKLSAKIDNSCIQDGYKLYQHNFILSEKGEWAVIQQGMNTENNYARRYHWSSQSLNNYLDEPHTAISCDNKKNKVLNMTNPDSKDARNLCVDLICDNPEHLKKYFKQKNNQQLLLDNFMDQKRLNLPKHHPVLDIDISDKEFQILKRAWEIQPDNYEELIALKGFGPKKIRALALISNLIYGEQISWNDPVKYSFTHGGKDGFPYPVDREVYDNSIETLKTALNDSKLKNDERISAIKRLNNYIDQ